MRCVILAAVVCGLALAQARAADAGTGLAHLAAGEGQVLGRPIPTCAPANSTMQESKAGEITAYLRPESEFHRGPSTRSRLSPATPIRPLSQFALPHGSSIICMSGSTSGNCGCKARRRAPRSRNRSSRISSAPCSSTCATPSCRPCRRRRCWPTPRRTWIISTRNWPSAATATAPATSRAWIWTASCCSACSTNRTYQTRPGKLADGQNHAADAVERSARRVDQFDVTGSFEFHEQLPPLDDFHTVALATPSRSAGRLAGRRTRPRTDHKLAVANGSTDPTFAVDIGAIRRSLLTSA